MSSHLHRCATTGFVVTISSLVACASPHATVTAWAGGDYVAKATAGQGIRAEQTALQAARSTCADRGGRLTVLSSDIRYKGLVSEDANRTIDKARDLLLVTTGTAAPGLGTAEDYTANLRFVCDALDVAVAP